MPRFSFIAQNKEKAVSRGDIEAQTREKVIEVLMRRGLSPIKVELVAGGGKSQGVFSKIAHFRFGSKLTVFDQIIIVRKLGTILNTGTDLLTGLEIIAQDSLKPDVRRICYDIKERVTRGQKLSDAIHAWKDQFNPVLVNLVRAGEASGNLPEILISYSQELRKDAAFVRKIKGAMIYPAILVTAMGAMIILVLSIVTPRIKELFSSLKSEPPWYTKIFFLASDLWLKYTTFFMIAIGVLLLLVFTGFKSRKVMRRITAVLWHLPLLNTIQKNLSLMRFAKTSANLLQAGFTLKETLLVASNVAGVNYENAVTDIAQKKLEAGISLADSFRYYPKLFPEIFVSLVATGEKSGGLGSVLAQLAEYYEEEVIYALDVMLTLIEPILLLVVGVIVALLASSLIAPIYKIIGSIH